MVKDTTNLSREELLEILRRQQREIERLKSENERLKRKLSAAPFAKGTRKKNPKRPGRKPGQGRFARRRPPPAESSAETVRVPVEETCCPYRSEERRVGEERR